MDAIQLFAEQFAGVRYKDLPADVVEVTKKEVLDLFAVALAGHAYPGVRQVVELVREWGGKPESSLIYFREKVPAPMAAWANATVGHALDFDDVHDGAVMHPAVPLVPSCMAIAERRGQGVGGQVDGKEFITALAIGVDMICRLALASWPGYDPARPETRDLPFHAQRVNHGWHFTTLMGYLASAGAAGRLLGLDEERLINAMGVAYHQCSGNHQGRDDGTHTKRLGPGFSARAGVASALLAERGVTGPRNVLEGHMGLFKMYFQGGYDRDTLIADLGSRYEGVNVSFKPYPCCRGTHTSIDAALELVQTKNLKPEDVKEIRVYADEGGYQMLSTPLEVKARPRTPVDAQFSIPWGVATAVARGHVGLEHFTEEAIKSRDILGVAGKIKMILDHSLDTRDRTPSGKVEIETTSGQVYASRVDHPLGSPHRPMTFADCAAKFRSCASLPDVALPESQVERTIELIDRLESLPDVGEVMALLAP
jgi:2-methylcitrate dehydratase PrpD